MAMVFQRSGPSWLLLSETHLAPKRRFSMPEYTWCRKDRDCSDAHVAAGDVAILVHRRISHRDLPPPATTQIEACAVALEFYGFELCLFRRISGPAVELHHYRSGRPPRQRSPNHHTGDLKSKYHSWNSRTSNPYTTSLRRPVEDDASVLVIGPTKPTHFP